MAALSMDGHKRLVLLTIMLLFVLPDVLSMPNNAYFPGVMERLPEWQSGSATYDDDIAVRIKSLFVTVELAEPERTSVEIHFESNNCDRVAVTTTKPEFGVYYRFTSIGQGYAIEATDSFNLGPPWEVRIDPGLSGRKKRKKWFCEVISIAKRILSLLIIRAAFISYV